MVNLNKRSSYRAPTPEALRRIARRIAQPRPAVGSVELSWGGTQALKAYR